MVVRETLRIGGGSFCTAHDCGEAASNPCFFVLSSYRRVPRNAWRVGYGSAAPSGALGTVLSVEYGIIISIGEKDVNFWGHSTLLLPIFSFFIYYLISKLRSRRLDCLSLLETEQVRQVQNH